MNQNFSNFCALLHIQSWLLRLAVRTRCLLSVKNNANAVGDKHGIYITLLSRHVHYLGNFEKQDRRTPRDVYVCWTTTPGVVSLFAFIAVCNVCQVPTRWFTVYVPIRFYYFNSWIGISFLRVFARLGQRTFCERENDGARSITRAAASAIFLRFDSSRAGAKCRAFSGAFLSRV